MAEAPSQRATTEGPAMTHVWWGRALQAVFAGQRPDRLRELAAHKIYISLKALRRQAVR